MQERALFHDRYGLALSSSSARAVEHYIEGVDRLLSLNAGWDSCLLAAIEADEGFALPHAALAIVRQNQGRTEDAKASVARARELAAGTTRREQRHVEAIGAAIAGENARALALIREQLAEYARDALLLYQAGGLISSSGNRDRNPQRYALHADLASHYGDDWWFLSSFGFVHHELDLLEESRRLSERSLALYPRNSNASHNVAHVFYETSDYAGGSGFLGGWIAEYDTLAPFHCHLSWHLALFELASGHYSRVLQLYEQSISPAVTQQRTTLEDAASLLWRRQLYGCESEPLPWEAVCRLADGKTAKPGVAFADIHAGLAYAAAGDETAMGRLVDGLRKLEARGHALAGSVTLPLVLGTSAFAHGDYEEAIRCMEPLADDLVRAGGSHAQREVFEDTLLEAYLRSGRFDRAEQFLRRRLDRRPSPRDLFWLGRAQAGSGQAEAAQRSLADADRAWPDAEPGAPEQAALRQLQTSLAGA